MAFNNDNIQNGTTGKFNVTPHTNAVTGQEEQQQSWGKRAWNKIKWGANKAWDGVKWGADKSYTYAAEHPELMKEVGEFALRGLATAAAAGASKISPVLAPVTYQAVYHGTKAGARKLGEVLDDKYVRSKKILHNATRDIDEPKIINSTPTITSITSGAGSKSSTGVNINGEVVYYNNSKPSYKGEYVIRNNLPKKQDGINASLMNSTNMIYNNNVRPPPVDHGSNINDSNVKSLMQQAINRSKNKSSKGAKIKNYAKKHRAWLNKK